MHAESLVNSYSFEIVRKGHLIAYEKLLRITITQSYKVMKGMSLTMGQGSDMDMVGIVENKGGCIKCRIGGPGSRNVGDRSQLNTGGTRTSQYNG